MPSPMSASLNCWTAALAAGAAFGAAGACAGFGEGAVGATVEVAAGPPTSTSMSTAPTFTVAWTLWWSFTTFPVYGLVSSTEALSLSTAHTLSISFTISPSLTNHSVSCTSAIPSPMSASLNCSIARGTGEDLSARTCGCNEAKGDPTDTLAHLHRRWPCKPHCNNALEGTECRVRVTATRDAVHRALGADIVALRSNDKVRQC
mmetsp:Transcript_96907/g.269581  ORF Transcript_96907/g.269581 Transcript_96907/m.269581 type:complete len:204 (+) Transcript_96907:218-829(+)